MPASFLEIMEVQNIEQRQLYRTEIAPAIELERTSMHQLRSIAYISSATCALSDEDLERLLVDARSFNESVGVTGVLLYNGTSFFQHFEGDAVACERVFKRINGSSLHHSVHTLVDRPGQVRYFSNWTMGFSTATKSQLLALSQAEWLASRVVSEPLSHAESNGIALLKAYWQAARGAP